MGRRESAQVTTITWHLSAMKRTPDAIKQAKRMQFYRICQDYVLIYSRSVPDQAIEIQERDLCELTNADCEWLEECNTEIMQQFAKEHEESIQKGQINFLKEFERELKRERLKGEEV